MRELQNWNDIYTRRFSFRAALFALILHTLRLHSISIAAIFWQSYVPSIALGALYPLPHLFFHNNPKIGLGFLPLSFFLIPWIQSVSKFCHPSSNYIPKLSTSISQYTFIFFSPSLMFKPESLSIACPLLHSL